jgi:hypothetical protein
MGTADGFPWQGDANYFSHDQVAQWFATLNGWNGTTPATQTRRSDLGIGSGAGGGYVVENLYPVGGTNPLTRSWLSTAGATIEPPPGQEAGGTSGGGQHIQPNGTTAVQNGVTPPLCQRWNHYDILGTIMMTPPVTPPPPTTYGPPTTGLLDNFNRANGAPGASWGAAVSTYALPNIVTSALDFPQFPSAYWKTSFGKDQDCHFKCNAKIEVLVRFNNPGGGAENGYSVLCGANNSNNGDVSLYKWTSGLGSRTQLDYQGGICPVMTATPWYVWVSAIGNIITLYVSNDGISYTLVKSWTDSTYNVSGFIGVFHPNNSTLPALVDDFAGGGIASGPTNTVAPTITGGMQVGQVLTCNEGIWSPQPSSFSYQWLRANTSGGSGSANIAGATSKTYTPVTADAGKYIAVQVYGNA